MKKRFMLGLTLILCIGMITMAFAADYSARYSDNTLKRSSTVKNVVKNVQADFNKNTTYNLGIDGIYGSMTFKAAKEFQTKQGLSVDGETGKYTKTKLYPLRDTNYNY